jgi:hypothetical protein
MMSTIGPPRHFVSSGNQDCSSGCGNPARPASVSRAISERFDKHSVPEIFKPGQNQPLYNSKDHCG